MARRASVHRTTTETDIDIAIDLDGGSSTIASGHGFLDHMLEQLARHGRLGLSVKARGDLHVDVHHLAEDIGITLGQAVAKALGDRHGIERYGEATVPMDETLVHVVVDLSGRPFAAFEPAGYEGSCNGFNLFHLRELLRGFCNHAGVTMHVRVLAGQETHHLAEATVKAWARALRTAVTVSGDTLPSTKGVL